MWQQLGNWLWRGFGEDSRAFLPLPVLVETLRKEIPEALKEDCDVT